LFRAFALHGGDSDHFTCFGDKWSPLLPGSMAASIFRKVELSNLRTALDDALCGGSLKLFGAANRENICSDYHRF
jgi:hypothetical protein